MSASKDLPTDPRPLTVGLVNNMPDAAFVDTEQQFQRAMSVDPELGQLELQHYTIPELPRSEAISELIASRYRDLDDLWEDPPDALIVTGTEPAQRQLHYEPYWPYLARLLEWAAESVPITLLSCLASHACVLLFDEIERVPRASKCFGVFAGAVKNPSDPLAAGLPELVPVPHSRVNDVPEAALVDAGYRIIVGSGPAQAGWSVAARNFGDRLFVLCQGHPEYSALSLLREYRRDVRRSLFKRRAIPYPDVPENYLSSEGEAILNDFADRAAAPGADPRELSAEFPFEAAAVTVQSSWPGVSATLYANWLGLAKLAPAARGTARA